MTLGPTNKPQSADNPETRRLFRRRANLLALIVCVPASAYVDRFVYNHESNPRGFVEFLAGFLLAFLFGFYWSSKVTDIVMRRKFGEPEIAEQEKRNRKLKAKVEALKEKRRRDPVLASEDYEKRLFGLWIAPCVIVCGLLFGGTGILLGSSFETSGVIGAIIGFVIAGLIGITGRRKSFPEQPVPAVVYRAAISVYWAIWFFLILPMGAIDLHHYIRHPSHYLDAYDIERGLALVLYLLALVFSTRVYLSNRRSMLIHLPLAVFILFVFGITVSL
jgi:hypothetical protein